MAWINKTLHWIMDLNDNEVSAVKDMNCWAQGWHELNNMMHDCLFVQMELMMVNCAKCCELANVFVIVNWLVVCWLFPQWFVQPLGWAMGGVEPHGASFP